MLEISGELGWKFVQVRIQEGACASHRFYPDGYQMQGPSGVQEPRRD